MLIDTYFARQPILDRRRRVRAYEVLYRSGPATEARFADGSAATAHVLAGAFVDVELPDLLSGLPGWVNLPRDLIVERALLAFPPDRVGGEILEDVEPDPEVLAAVKELRDLGYQLALDDYRPGHDRDAFLPYVDVVKVDIMGLTPDELRQTVRKLRMSDVTLLAEKVETQDEFELCEALGFELFQGYFFARPELVAGRRLDAGRSQLVALLAELHSDQATVDRIARQIETHATVSYQLLRILNSASVGLTRQISSIREAVVMLGTRRIIELVSVLVLAAFDHKPRELLSIGLTRARMCELLATQTGMPDPASYFTVGIFSVLDALTDQPLREVIRTLPLADDVQAALVDREGHKGQVLEAAIAYERAAWANLPDLGVEPKAIAMSYIDALDWTENTLGSFA